MHVQAKLYFIVNMNENILQKSIKYIEKSLRLYYNIYILAQLFKELNTNFFYP